MRCDAASLEIVTGVDGLVATEAQPDDFGKEHLALVATVKVVDSLDEALDAVYRYRHGVTRTASSPRTTRRRSAS